MATRAITMLPCITGSWKEVGGGLQLSTSGAFGLNKEALERTDLMSHESRAGPAGPDHQHGGTGSGPEHAEGSSGQGPVRLQLESGGGVSQSQRRCSRACCVLTCSPSCTNSSLPTRLTTLTLCFRRPRSSSTRICRLRTGITICKCRTRPSSRWVSAGRMSKYFARWRSAWDLTDDCFGESVDQMIDAALNSENPRLQGIDRDRLQREGHVKLNFGKQFSDSGSQFPAFLPFAEGNFGTSSAAKPSSTARISSGRVWTRLWHLFRLPNRGTVRKPRRFPWSCWPARRTTF